MSNWNDLLYPGTFRRRGEKLTFDGRDPFENDYGRVISSFPIRRLQDKTQVFPLETSDFIRTRLTHSLEVSYIGSSIGKSVEKILEDKKLFPKELSGQISSLLRIAGLVHDIGNPPYGHFGEFAIQEFFNDYFNCKTKVFIDDNDRNKFEVHIKKLNDAEKADFCCFDGNVQAFRILRKLHYFKDENSYNLTYPTLASVIKYPFDSITGNKKPYDRISEKKFGYFSSEKNDYEILANKLGILNKRHPITFLLEAADDIAYSAADIEDGVRLGLLNYDLIIETFSKNLQINKKLVKKFKDIYAENEKVSSDRLFLTVQRFRVETQTAMIKGVIDCFIKNYKEIMNGTYEKELLLSSKCADIRTSYKVLQQTVFDNKKIMQSELAGREVLYGLLSVFVPATESKNFQNNSCENCKEARLYKLISSTYRYIYENHNNYGNDVYNRIQLVVDFICGMTDNYALDLYRKLKGISL